ncbi:glutamate--tRNA ligase family protein [Negadavirga shengliensis]|uniref:Glutamate--tRNA ligase family protein n=1 Tax=Negadavirga shengliensis TaxID=1389218 RepID=A0ABV9T2A5_9BACT
MLKKWTKTRIAPTPSGFLHIGNIMSFLITVSLARIHGSKILLRIDDLDKARTKPAYVQDIFDTLDFLEIPYDEGPQNISDLNNTYTQFCRMPHYQAALEWLMEENRLFACDCSRKKVFRHNDRGIYPGLCLGKNLSLQKDQVNWRLVTDHSKAITVIDYPDKPSTHLLPEKMQHFVVRTKNQLPAYQLASLVDDLFFGVDFVVRGGDLWESTLAQLYLSGLFPANNFQKTVFFHHPLIYHNNSKLSKSAGATSIRYMRKKGMGKKDIYRLIGKHLQFEEQTNGLDDFRKNFLQKLT